jgi:UDP-N-acetylmuramoyl-tripeptide--D-alanyl-D-alanine ligase
MMSLNLLADVFQKPVIGGDATFTGVCTDSRSLRSGDLFVALVGERFDGHNFLAEAITAGAAAAMLSQRVNTSLPYLLVDDTRLGLGRFAAFWRRQFKIPLVGVTGSNGKTTVKEMIASILSEQGPCCATQGNLNNDIGLPLSLLRLRKKDKSAVIEMGMNHLGEIDYLTKLAQPTVAIITNAAIAHLEGLGSLEEIAKAKSEIFSGLAPGGVAVINADDRFAHYWRNLAGRRPIVTFGIDQVADVHAAYEMKTFGSSLQLKTPQGVIEVTLHLLGRHNVRNAVGAAAAALAAGATASQVKAGLEKARPVKGRLELRPGKSNARVIDDTYNANPGSVQAALETLREFQGDRVLVLGDMRELGGESAALHRRMGQLASDVGIQRLYTVGDMTRISADAFGKGARHFGSHEELSDVLIDSLHAGVTVLVKGSRAMQMEKIVNALVRGGHPGRGH